MRLAARHSNTKRTGNVGALKDFIDAAKKGGESLDERMTHFQNLKLIRSFLVQEEPVNLELDYYVRPGLFLQRLMGLPEGDHVLYRNSHF